MWFKTVNIFFVVAVLSQNVLAQMGPVDLDIVDAGNCDPDQYVSFDLTSLSDTDRGLTVNISVPFDLDPSVTYSIVVDRVEDGDVQEGVFRYGGPDFCNDIEKYMGKVWIDLAKELGMSDDCPKKQGDYYTKDFLINYDDIKIDAFLYGRFQMKVELLRLGSPVACVYIEFTNTPPDESRR